MVILTGLNFLSVDLWIRSISKALYCAFIGNSFVFSYNLRRSLSLFFAFRVNFLVIVYFYASTGSSFISLAFKKCSSFGLGIDYASFFKFLILNALSIYILIYFWIQYEGC